MTLIASHATDLHVNSCDGMGTFLIKYDLGPCSMATAYSNQGHEIFGFVDFPSNILKGWEWTSHVFLTRNKDTMRLNRGQGHCSFKSFIVLATASL